MIESSPESSVTATRLQRWAQQQAADWASQHPDAEVRVAEVIGACDELAAVVVDRYLGAASDAEEAPQLYLSALVLRDRKVVIAGAGRVASALGAAGAVVTFASAI